MNLWETTPGYPGPWQKKWLHKKVYEQDTSGGNGENNLLTSHMSVSVLFCHE